MNAITEMESRAAYKASDAKVEFRLTDDESTIWNSVRKTISNQIGVQEEHIYPDDTLDSIMRLIFPLPDLMQFIYAIENCLDVRLDRSDLKKILESTEPATIHCLASAVITRINSTKPLQNAR